MNAFIQSIRLDNVIRNRCEPTLVQQTSTCTSDSAEWIQVACGFKASAGLTRNGEVYTWGRNYDGQLGHGDKVSRNIPTKVKGLNGIVIIQISCGAWHMAAVSDKGELFTWYVSS